MFESVTVKVNLTLFLWLWWCSTHNMRAFDWFNTISSNQMYSFNNIPLSTVIMLSFTEYAEHKVPNLVMLSRSPYGPILKRRVTMHPCHLYDEQIFMALKLKVDGVKFDMYLDIHIQLVITYLYGIGTYTWTTSCVCGEEHRAFVMQLQVCRYLELFRHIFCSTRYTHCY